MGGKPTTDVMPTGVAVHGKSLRITFQYRGQRCRESLGLAPTKSNIKYAAGKLAAIKYEIKTGVFIYSAHFPNSINAQQFLGRNQRTGIRIGELCEEFKILKFTEVSAYTAKNMNCAYKQCLKILGPERLISALYPEDIRRIRAELITTRAASTTNNYMAAFRELLVFAEKNGYTDKKLSNELNYVTIYKKDPDPFSLDEMQRALKACNFIPDYNMFKLAVYTGLRPGELMAIAWEDVDFERQELTISRAIIGKTFKLPKTNKSRVISLSPPALEALRDQKKFTFMKEPVEIVVVIGPRDKKKQAIRAVFSPMDRRGYNKDPFFNVSTLRSIWKTTTKRAGIRHRTIYQLRHTFACWNLTAHGNVAFIAKQMGHSDYTMLVKIYGRWMDAESKSENTKIWDALKALGHVVNAPSEPQFLKRLK